MDVFTTVSYEELVEQGREARQQADNVQWVEGDLALQIEALPADGRPRDPETGAFLADPDKALKRYAEDIEVAYSTLQTYRRTAEAWPRSERSPGASWVTHYRLNSLEDRFDLIHPGMTTREAERIARDRQPKANYGGEPGWIELLGHVGDSLIAADKALTKTEQAIDRRPRKHVRDQAEKYAGWADALAKRLRDLTELT